LRWRTELGPYAIGIWQRLEVDFVGIRTIRTQNHNDPATQIGVQNYTYTFKAVGEKLTGKTKSQFGESGISEGIVKGDEIKFTRNVADLSDEPFVA